MISAPLLIAIFLGASAFEETFQSGVQGYHRGDYSTSISAFERLIDQGVEDRAVFYNLGNAYYRANRLGPAIANFERALQIDPSMVDARENLNRSINQTERRLSKPPPGVWEQAILFWHDGLKPRTSILVAVCCWILFWAALAVRAVHVFPYSRWAMSVLLLLAVGFASSGWIKTHPAPLAVASASRVSVHYGMDETETVRFELFEGDRVGVDRRENGWALVLTADGERGWTQERFLTFVGPPYEPAPPVIDEVDPGGTEE